MGRVFGKHLGSLAGFGLGLRPKGFRLGRLMPKPKYKASHQTNCSERAGLSDAYRRSFRLETSAAKFVKPSSAAEHVKPPSPFGSSPLSVSDLIPLVTLNAFLVPTTPESYSRMVTGWLTVGGLEAVSSEITKVAGTMTSASLGCSIR